MKCSFHKKKYLNRSSPCMSNTHTHTHTHTHTQGIHFSHFLKPSLTYHSSHCVNTSAMVGEGSWNIIEEILKTYWTGKAKHIEKIFVLLHFYHIECTYEGKKKTRGKNDLYCTIYFSPQLCIVNFIHFIITIADKQQLYTIQISTDRQFSQSFARQQINRDYKPPSIISDDLWVKD